MHVSVVLVDEVAFKKALLQSLINAQSAAAIGCGDESFMNFAIEVDGKPEMAQIQGVTIQSGLMRQCIICWPFDSESTWSHSQFVYNALTGEWKTESSLVVVANDEYDQESGEKVFAWSH